MAVLSLAYAGRLGRAAVVLASCGLLLAIIALATPFWRSSDSEHEGLWEKCVNSTCWQLYSSNTLEARLSDGVDGWFQSVQVLETIGLILSFGAVLVSVLYACAPPVSSPTVAVWGTVTSFVAGLCTLVGVVIYSQKAPHEDALQLSWSFGLAILSSAFQCLAGIVLLTSVRRQRRGEDM